MIETLLIILALIIGILAGTITGLIPGLHVNMLAIFLISISATLLTYFSPLTLVIFIVAMSITHTFLDFIPSIFLGAPDEDTGLSILPGHEMLNQGKGHNAVIFSLIGSCLGIIIILISAPLIIFLLPKIYSAIKAGMFLILLTASIYLILRERKSKLLALFIFILSGFLGISTFSLSLNNSLLPLLTGLFGASSLITSMIKIKRIPKQKIEKIKKILKKNLRLKEITDIGVASILSAPLCTFLPSLGSNQAAIIGSDILKEKNKKQFLILLGSINTIVAGLAIVTFYSINETRTGTTIAINKILENISTTNLFIILGAIILAGTASVFLTIKISQFFAKRISKLNYRLLSTSILILLSTFVLIFSGGIGLLIFLTATATGLIAILTGIRRTHLLGSLMIPTILLYWPF